jgi:hypothetical protein
MLAHMNNMHVIAVEPSNPGDFVTADMTYSPDSDCFNFLPASLKVFMHDDDDGDDESWRTMTMMTMMMTMMMMMMMMI